MEKWTANEIPDLSGKVIIVTGANSGLGYESTLALVKKHATVIMACRDMAKAQSALEAIKGQAPNTNAILMRLDLGDLASVRQFVADFQSRYDRLDVLMNNAGVMALPYQETPDGFETQLGINHLGHFALTGLLLETLLETSKSRIVNVSSALHRSGIMHFDDLHMKKHYDPWQAYNQSKLANVLFTLALHKRLNAARTTTLAVAAHPGYAATNLQGRTLSPLANFFATYIMNPLVAQSQAMGALPQLYAAVAPNIEGGAYYGPHLRFRGYPVQETPSKRAQNADDAERLWQLSVEMTGIAYAALQ